MAGNNRAARPSAQSELEAYQQLFLTVAESVKNPLMFVGRQAELAQQGDATTAWRDIEETADTAVKLLDSYILSLRLSMEVAAGMALAMEPVSLAATLRQTERQLAATARQYDIELELHIQGRFEPVLTNPQALSSVLLSLGYALIEALPAGGSVAQGQTRRLRLAAHRSRQGLVAGVYGDFATLTPGVLRRGRELHGHVRQPLVGALPGPGAGIFLADSIATAMQSRLRVGRFHNWPGLALTLPPSQQLQLV